MGGNSFGTLFRVTTWGESHGKALGVVIDGCRPLEWKKDWYPIARISPELRAKLGKKWQTILSDLI
jgi:hypothetical protein